MELDRGKPSNRSCPYSSDIAGLRFASFTLRDEGLVSSVSLNACSGLIAAIMGFTVGRESFLPRITPCSAGKYLEFTGSFSATPWIAIG